MLGGPCERMQSSAERGGLLVSRAFAAGHRRGAERNLASFGCIPPGHPFPLPSHQDSYRILQEKAGTCLEHSEELTEGPHFTWRGNPGRDIPEHGKYFRKVMPASLLFPCLQSYLAALFCPSWWQRRARVVSSSEEGQA